MDKKVLADRIDISLRTVYNWQDEKPELMNLIYLGIATEENFHKTKEYLTNQKNLLNLPEKENEFLDLKYKKIELGKRLNVGARTLTAWETEKPELTKLIRYGLAMEKHIAETENFLEILERTHKSES